MTTTFVDAARALSLPFLDEVSLYDQLVAEYGIDPLAEALLRTEALATAGDAPEDDPTSAAVLPVAVEVPAVIAAEVEDVAVVQPVADEAPTDAASAEEEPEWENLSEETDEDFADGFEVLLAYGVDVEPEDVTPEALAAALTIIDDEGSSEDEPAPTWQETVLPEPTEADVKANQTLLEEIGVYFGDDLPEMPPFEHDQPQQP